MRRQDTVAAAGGMSVNPACAFLPEFDGHLLFLLLCFPESLPAFLLNQFKNRLARNHAG